MGEKIRKNVFKPFIVFLSARPRMCTFCTKETDMESTEIIDDKNLLKPVYPNGCSGLMCSVCHVKFVFNKES